MFPKIFLKMKNFSQSLIGWRIEYCNKYIHSPPNQFSYLFFHFTHIFIHTCTKRYFARNFFLK